jgi:hypothetical protein
MERSTLKARDIGHSSALDANTTHSADSHCRNITVCLAAPERSWRRAAYLYAVDAARKCMASRDSCCL